MPYKGSDINLPMVILRESKTSQSNHKKRPINEACYGPKSSDRKLFSWYLLSVDSK